ncbi:ensconsin isoform X16 [Dermochelys coriacea]|uniref:ensconsin isoform X16 n=1 Tax=Dermochelys coriacea TaxID=27794 RepID=UPI0018E8AEF6|nr:ensconsin isoform X16 [Dermochelys coriacea]
MPGAATTIRQERLKKTSARTNPPGLFTINEEDEQQKNGNAKRLKASEDSKVQDKKAASSSHPTSAASRQSPNNFAAKAVVVDHPPVLKVDDRQRLARIRREEREKQLAARESVWLEKEERARQHYEKHLEERKKKLEEQRLKEERRRAAVEEKRKQRIEEDKERHEAVVRRTIERSQKPKQKQNRWSWGGPLQRSSSINNTARRLNLSPLEKSIVSRLLMPTHSFLARSKSTAALSGDAVIPICPRSASCSPINPLSYKAMNCRNPADQAKFFVTTTGHRRTTQSAGTDKKEKDPSFSVKRLHSPSNPKTRSLALSPVWHASKSLPFLPGTPKERTSPPGSSKVTSTQTLPPSPGNIRPIKKELKPDSQKKGPEKQPEKAAEEQTEEGKAISAGASESAIGEGLPVKLEPAQVTAPALPPAPPATSPSPVSSKASAGTTDPEEATRLLTEKRRLAREQREREEQEKKEREETERLKKEALSQKIAEERARREEEEARRQEAERKRMEREQEREKEEELRRQAEERDQKEKEEMERIQKQKEEEARLSEEAERTRLEREKRFQREEQERLERKKRLEEIMKRTRRTEVVDKKSNEQQNGELSKANITGETATSPKSPLESVVTSQLQHVTESPDSGESVTHSQIVISHQPTVNMDSNLNPGREPNENGVSMQNDNFEELINLPTGSKPSTLDALNNDGSNSPEIPLNPILAFEDKGTLGPLPQVDSVQTHHTAEVI